MHHNEKIRKMITSSTKKMEEATGTLSRLFRKILFDINIDLMRWDAAMKKYLADPRNRIQQNSKDISSARGNLAKALVKPDMTWKVFVKALKFLDPLCVSLEVKIVWRNGRKTLHPITVFKDPEYNEIAEPGYELESSEDFDSDSPLHNESKRVKDFKNAIKYDTTGIGEIPNEEELESRYKDLLESVAVLEKRIKSDDTVEKE